MNFYHLSKTNIYISGLRASAHESFMSQKTTLANNRAYIYQLGGKQMCLINFAFQAHPQYPFIVAANRDEFHKRETAPAHIWEEYPFLLGGKDLEKGGMWLGVTSSGRFAALTNYREIVNYPEEIRSRGELVKDYLIGNMTPLDYVTSLVPIKDEFPGFNLLVGNGEELYVFSNRSNEIEKISAGVYSLCNGDFHCNWPKVRLGKDLIKDSLQIKSEQELIQFLMKGLKDQTKAPDQLLPDTGVGIELERFLSSIYISGEDYGTRSSTVMIMNKKNEIHFAEKSYMTKSKEQVRSFVLSNN